MKNIACVWQKRFYDNSVLININNVEARKCFVYFCADKNYPNLYSYDGKQVMDKCSIQKNGNGYCYIIPMKFLIDEGPLPEQFYNKRDLEYAKYIKYYEKHRKKI